jgi:hypothetical protein
MASDTSVSPVSSRRGSAESLHRVTPMPSATVGPRLRTCAVSRHAMPCKAFGLPLVLGLLAKPGRSLRQACEHMPAHARRPMGRMRSLSEGEALPGAVLEEEDFEAPAEGIPEHEEAVTSHRVELPGAPGLHAPRAVSAAPWQPAAVRCAAACICGDEGAAGILRRGFLELLCRGDARAQWGHRAAAHARDGRQRGGVTERSAGQQVHTAIADWDTCTGLGLLPEDS